MLSRRLASRSKSQCLGTVTRSFVPVRREHTGCRLTTPRLARSPFGELISRGLVAKLSDNQVDFEFSRPSTVYLGVDPTAAAIHAGNLLALMALFHFHIAGHQVISLTGGATGTIGDPGGRSTERPLLSAERVKENASKIGSQIRRVFSNGVRYAEKRNMVNTILHPPKFLDNLEWFGGMALLEFLRLVGKRATVNVMMAKDSVKSRLSSEHGISFTEFSYQLLQAYDYYVLYRDHGCRLQIGGSDQWGNITAGLELIRRAKSEPLDECSSDISKENGPAYGMTMPLLLTSSGEKFGKSAGNAVWLDPELTSVFDFYQFFLRVTDSDVAKYLKMFTLLSLAEIEKIVVEHEAGPERRVAQRMLASEVTEFVHGEIATTQAKTASSILFPNPSESLTAESSHTRVDDLIAALGSDRRLVLRTQEEFLRDTITKLAATFGLTNSRGEARKLLASGGLYLNDRRLTEDSVMSHEDFTIDRRVAILRAGKDQKLVLVIKGEGVLHS